MRHRDVDAIVSWLLVVGAAVSLLFAAYCGGKAARETRLRDVGDVIRRELQRQEQ